MKIIVDSEKTKDLLEGALRRAIRLEEESDWQDEETIAESKKDIALWREAFESIEVRHDK